jgi:hypothetical protein
MRIDEGFKMQVVFLRLLIQNGPLHHVSSKTVFPREVAVTKVVWCMNKGFAGWYAAGMSCGLLRIEDINSE